MDFDLPADDDPRRLAVRAWLAEHPEPSNAELHAAGYIVPHWPEPWGLAADPIHQLVALQAAPRLTADEDHHDDESEHVEVAGRKDEQHGGDIDDQPDEEVPDGLGASERRHHLDVDAIGRGR